MRVCDDSGSPLDAAVEITGDAETMRVVFESRGGSRLVAGSTRNTDYIPALELVLSRLVRLNARITDAFLVSATARRRLSEEDRRLHLLGFPFPVHLAEHQQVNEFARRLRRAAAEIGRTPYARGSGNPTKRIEIRFQLPELARRPSAWVVEQLLNPLGQPSHG